MEINKNLSCHMRFVETHLCKESFPEHCLASPFVSFLFGRSAQGIGGSLRRAGTTLTRLKIADLMDAVVMVASTLFFFGTVCFVLYQRLPTLGLL